MYNFKSNQNAEAIDEDCVWHKCKVICVNEDEVIVSFDGWSSKFNRSITNANEIRQTSYQDYPRCRNLLLESIIDQDNTR